MSSYHKLVMTYANARVTLQLLARSSMNPRAYGPRALHHYCANNYGVALARMS